jgi:hypothetical protein
MLNSSSAEGARDELHSRLESVPGVLRAVAEEGGDRVFLICEGAPHPDFESEVREAAVELGVVADSLELGFCYTGRPDAQRRVRFAAVEMEHARASATSARVLLEWEGESFEGSAEGETGGAFEIRTSAQATIHALQRVLADRLTFHLVGVKALRIFDHDLVAVLLHSPEAPDRRLVGTSLVLDDMHRASALAVLNATNRLVGSYLPVR